MSLTPSPWPDRVARGFALLRGAVLIFFSLALMLAPEKAMPGSSVEPARSLGLVFGSRTLLLGLVLVVLAGRGRRLGLGWVLLADAALQVFDMGLAITGGKGAVAVAPLAIGAVDAWAGLYLVRGARVPAAARTE